MGGYFYLEFCVGGDGIFETVGEHGLVVAGVFLAVEKGEDVVH